MDRVCQTEELIGYSFLNKTLLIQALTHRSYRNEHPGEADYERLEFLGDAVLELVSSACLYARFPGLAEGEMTRMRASLVCEPALSSCAKKLGIGRYIRLGRGESMSGGQLKDTILADVMEAVIGAVYLDCGEEIGPPRKFITDTVLSEDNLRGIRQPQAAWDAKSRLQIKAQETGLEISYEVISESGLPHEKEFECAVYLGGREAGRGKGHNKKQAEQAAAAEALAALDGVTECI